MGRFAAIVFLIATALLSMPALACRNIEPSATVLDEYSSVFVGRVTGLHLKGYENQLLGVADVVGSDLGIIRITNGASPVRLRVAVLQRISGPADGAIDLGLTGCTFDVPDLKDRGIFFVRPGGSTTLVVWERDQANFQNWLARLGAAPNDR